MLILITGGAGCGKSAFAEKAALSLQPAEKYYIATMLAYDEESFQRIARHRQMRANKGFITIEHPFDISAIKTPPNATILLECMSNLLANEMFDQRGTGDNAVSSIIEGIKSLNTRNQNVLIVTNEVFSDAACFDEMTNNYINNLGILNARMTEIADTVVEVVYTLPLCHKGALHELV